MAENIELFDRKRRVYYRGWVIGFIIFMVLWVVRFGLKWAGLQSETIDWALGIGLALTIPLMFYFIIRMDSLRSFYSMERE